MGMAKLYTREEARRRRVRYQIFAGMFDFLAIIAGVIVIIACILLISTLVRWLRGDLPVTFRSLWSILQKAIIVPQ